MSVKKPRPFPDDFAEPASYHGVVESNSMDTATQDRPSRAAWTMNVKPAPGWLYGALIVVLSVWILHSFLQAVLAACVTATASWPLYARFVARSPWRMRRSVSSLIFTFAMTVFVLVPLVFAFGSLLIEGHALLVEIAAADKRGVSAPHWLETVPLIGSWAAARWQSDLAYPGALLGWTQRPAALLGLAQSLGQFMARHAFIIGFTILLLFFLYQEGESLATGLRRVLRQRIGERADGYVDLAARAVRASVNSQLVVALFAGFATWVAYALAGIPHATVWAAITGLLSLVPFLGYVAVAALTLKLAVTGAAASPWVSLGLGFSVLLCGDKIVRPMVARGGVRLRFVWVLMGSLGGFETLGLVGLVVGPVVLTLARELWERRDQDLARGEGA
jgi:predicted PurR-regulated permease PerM